MRLLLMRWLKSRCLGLLLPSVDAWNIVRKNDKVNFVSKKRSYKISLIDRSDIGGFGEILEAYPELVEGKPKIIPKRN